MAKERTLYWDTLKGILIILVVFGHCGTAVGNNLLSVVYSFHMPLFVLVSGFFSKRQKSIYGGCKRLIIIYLVFHALYLSFDAALGNISFKRLLQPSFALWYILSLIFWRLMLQYIPNGVIAKKVLLISLSFIVSIAIGFIPVNTAMSFQRTFAYWPFFLIGFYIKQANAIGKIRKLNHSMAWLLLLTTLVGVFYFVPIMYCNHSYTTMPNDILTRSLQLFIACILCFTILIVCREKAPCFTELGKYTLLIYLLHPPMVKAMKVICIKAGYTPNLLIAIVITSLTVVGLYALRNLRIFKYLK